MRFLLPLLLFLGLASAQVSAPPSALIPLHSVEELSAYLQQNTRQITVIGDLPLRGLEAALQGKRVRLLTGSTQVQGLGWVRSGRLQLEVRVLPGRLTTPFLLADERYFLAVEPQRFTLLDSEEVVAVLRQRIRLSELWAQARPWRLP
ncbi:MAG: hypothetical protein SFU83_00015 [Meiothermus sp.]|nr:hypothetical protein [Meiothermus sp.]